MSASSTTRRYDRRYTIVTCSFIMQGVIIGSMFAYGVFFPFLEAEFGWSRTELSGCISMAMFIMGVFAFPGGLLIDKFGPRWILSVTGLLTAVGYVLMSTLSAPWQLYLYFGLLIGLGLSTHDVGTLSIIARIFSKRRGIMSGVVKVGTACGQMVIPLAVTALIALVEWRGAFVVLGVVAGIVLLAAAQGLRPEGLGPTSEDEADAKPVPQAIDFRQATRMPQFWLLCLAQFCFLPTLVTIPVHLPVHGVDLGMTVTGAATLLTLVGGASAVGRLVVGRIADWRGGRVALMICLATLGATLSFLTVAQTATALYVFAFIYGFAHGGLFTVVSPTVAEYFGMRAHGAIFGAILLSGTLGAALGPVAAGRVYDLMQSYDPAFLGLAALSFVGFVGLAFVRPPQAA